MKASAYIASDIIRYFGTEKPSLRQRFSHSAHLRYLRTLRKAKHAPCECIRVLYRIRLNRLSARTLLQIPWCCDIGPGFYIGHKGSVIMHPTAAVGANCNIGTGVTIGAIAVGSRKGAPRISDQVWIGTNAVVVGGIRVGTDVVIAPGSFVNFDVPDHSVVIGNPGVVHPKRNATAGYIDNHVDPASGRAV